MKELAWVTIAVVHQLHDRQLADHGGLPGVRDEGAIESAIARPRNLAAYGEPDPAALAASYLFGLARNHGFLDGNKRTAWVIARVFLESNAGRVSFEVAEAIRFVERVAAGDVSEQEAADWFRARLIG